ncbi:hypothetical protein OEZ82_27565, partial [Leclercia adecarboxylata]|uniref:hypothetical protein n=1 Tax=Leclercia adecarboxylata TaxID=83655 RepID=UPI00234D93CC
MAPKVGDLKISAGDEHRLKAMDNTILQAIADTICSQVEVAEPSLAGRSLSNVAYTSGQTIKVPDWVLSYRGHDLLPKVQTAFGGHKIVNPARLTKALRRCRLIPKELATLL